MKILLTVVITLVIAAIVVLAGAYVFFKQTGFSAAQKPPAIERWVVRTAQRISMPDDVASRKNPYPETAETLAEGREHYVTHCAACHGLDGKGKTEVSKGMYPPVPSLHGDVQQWPDGRIYHVIADGVRFSAMPAWSETHTPEELWALVNFVRHIPKVTPDEIKAMKQLAPQTGAALLGVEGHEHAHEHGAEPEEHQPKAGGAEPPEQPHQN